MQQLKLNIVHLDITPLCNLKCKHCYFYNANEVDFKISTPSVNTYMKWIHEAIELGAEYFVVSGGEPFMYKGLFDILEFMDKNNVYYVILTNGTLINDEVINKLRNLNNLLEIRVSLDGFKGHDYIRGNGTSHIVLRNLDKLTKQLDVPISINTVITKYNVEELRKLYQLFINKVRISSWRIDILMPLGRGKLHYKDLVADWNTVFRVYTWLINQYLKDKPEFRLRILNVFDSAWLVNELRDKFLILKFDENEHPCSYYFGNVTIQYNGNVKWCPSLPLIFGNLHKKSLREILNPRLNIKLARFLNIRLKDIAECARCKYKVICGGGCRANALGLHGDLLSQDNISCMLIKYFIQQVLPLLPNEIKHRILSLIQSSESKR